MRGVIVIATVFVAATVHAQSSPGPLTKSHAQLDDPAHCSSCHVNGTARLSNAQCAACHTFARGFHATQVVQGKSCWSCHGDHKGRGFDDSGWRSIGGIAKFDHTTMASWALKGAHAIGCDSCHAARTAGGFMRFAGLSTNCASCHQRVSPHGSMNMDCERCHSDAAWKPAKRAIAFDHDRDSQFPLVGSHRDVACAKCHPKGSFSPVTKECVGCHAAAPHQSKMFEHRPCEICHAPTFKTFKVFAFDHGEKTKFPLDAGHRIACVKCHTTALGTGVPTSRCEDCHASKLSQHDGRFDRVSGGCAACHTGVKWKAVTKFDHQQTKFPLAAKHAEIKCSECHRPIGRGSFENFRGQTGCKECHAHAKAHADAQNPNGKFTTQQCTQCHSPIHPSRPPLIQVFHGPGSRFPLVKAHKNVPCTDCHVARDKRGKTRFDAVSPECGDTCHEDNAHKGALGLTCSKCHTPGVWDALAFDHDAPFPDGRSFVLEGDHRAATCDACHGADKTFKGTSRRCSDAACHARDDVHDGHLGRTCDRCHLANGDNRFSHTIMSAFKLDGKHTNLPCADCHPSSEFKPRPRACDGCHPEPRAHFGEYGTWCARCHTTKSWAD